LKSASETVFPLVSGRRKSGATVPSGSIVELTATMEKSCRVLRKSPALIEAGIPCESTFAFLPGRIHVSCVSALEIHQLPRQEKLRLMELLWEDLSRNAAKFESPAWHADALRGTAERRARCEETILDWEEAKTKLLGS
jgi:hypothetical protein